MIPEKMRTIKYVKMVKLYASLVVFMVTPIKCHVIY